MEAKPPRGRHRAVDKSAGGKVADAAFDKWLARGLKRLYGDAAAEPLPPELLEVIEQDRTAKRKGVETGVEGHKKK